MEALDYLVNSGLMIEKIRIAAETRLTSLKNHNIRDTNTEELHKRTSELEQWVNIKIAELICQHPAYPWFSRVKGVTLYLK